MQTQASQEENKNIICRQVEKQIGKKTQGTGGNCPLVRHRREELNNNVFLCVGRHQKCLPVSDVRLGAWLFQAVLLPSSLRFLLLLAVLPVRMLPQHAAVLGPQVCARESSERTETERRR